MIAQGGNDIVERAVAQGDVALLAALARAGATLPAAAAPMLRSLSSDGVAVTTADADGMTLLSPTADAAPPVDSDHPPALLTTPKLRKALLALLAATDDPDSDLPYPGRQVPLAEVTALTRPGSPQAARHILGALRDLDLLGYCIIDEEASTVRPGPLLATWDDRWIREQLPAVLAQLRGDHEGNGA